MVRADAIFAATGVTNEALLDGVKVKGGFVHPYAGAEFRDPHLARGANEN